MHTELVHISDLPADTIDSVCDDIARYTVALNRVVRDGNREDLRLIGTGTLVTVCGLDCVLTADHVLAAIGDSDQLVLLSSFTGALRRHALALSHLVIHRIARGQVDSEGPDIGLIVLPQAAIGSLRAEKIFFNIDKRRDRFAESFLPRDRGFWFSCGLLGETEQDLGPAPGFSAVKGYHGICGASANPLESEISGFDYLEVQIDYKDPNPELPSSFGGCSGGGLWQVPMRKNEHGKIEAEAHLLSGVIFYQTGFDEGVRRLRCHGRKTVYNRVPEYLERQKRS